MGIGNCAGLIKVVVIFTNFIFWLIGLVITGLIIWQLINTSNVKNIDKNFTIGLYILLAAGILIFIVSFFGCIGAYNESSCLLITFSSCLFVIIVLELSAGIWADCNKDRWEPYYREYTQKTIQKDYWAQNSTRVIFDSIQSALECCGGEGPQDWARSNSDEVKYSVTAERDYPIPESCCIKNITKSNCEKHRHIKDEAINYLFIHKTGCNGKIMEYVKIITKWMLIGGIIVAVVQFIGIIFAIILINAFKSSDQYKA